MRENEQRKDPLVNTQDICDFLEISKPTLFRAIKKGEFPEPFRIGRSFTWLQSTVQKHLNIDSPIC